MRKQGVRMLAIICLLCLLGGCTSIAQDEGSVSSVPMPETEASVKPEEQDTSADNEIVAQKIEEGQLVTEVPELTVVCGGQSVTASGGTSSWHYTEGGSGVSMIGCGAHPLDAQEYMPVLKMTDEIAALVFTYAPDAWSASRWSDDNWGNTEAKSEPVMKSEDGTGLVLEKGYIYEIYAEWNAVKSSGGDSYYSFYVK